METVELTKIEDLEYIDILSMGAIMHHLEPEVEFCYPSFNKLGTKWEKIYPNVDKVFDFVSKLIDAGVFIHSCPEGLAACYPLQDEFFIKFDDLDLHFEDLLHGEFLSAEAQCFDIWVQLAKDEVGYHLRNEMLRLFNHDFNFGKKTEALISRLVANMPQSKINSLIYSAGNAALRFQKENHAGRPHVCNYMINLMDKNLDKFISKEWNYKDSWRSVPQSKFSEIFFNKVLKIGDAGFTTIPNKNIL